MFTAAIFITGFRKQLICLRDRNQVCVRVHKTIFEKQFLKQQKQFAKPFKFVALPTKDFASKTIFFLTISNSKIFSLYMCIFIYNAYISLSSSFYVAV